MDDQNESKSIKNNLVNLFSDSVTKINKKLICEICSNKIILKKDIEKNVIDVREELKIVFPDIILQSSGKICSICCQKISNVVDIATKCRVVYLDLFEGKEISKPASCHICQKKPLALNGERLHFIPNSLVLTMDDLVQEFLPLEKRPSKACHVCLNILRVAKSLRQLVATQNVSKSDFKIDEECKEEDDEIEPLLFGEPLNKPFLLKEIQCTSCPKMFIEENQLELHMNLIHNTKTKHCDLCNRKFLSVAAVRAHKRAVHFNSIEAICHFCGFTAKTVEKLDNHMTIHFDDRNFECELCGATFKIKMRLKNHMRSHTKQKPYQCRYCEKSYGQYTDRIRHEITIHTHKFPYYCNYCSKGFAKRSALGQHTLTHEKSG